MATSSSSSFPVPPPSLPPLGFSIPFMQGPFAGRTIRAELSELQSAKVGRRFAHKDRRPIDPPPIVQLHLYQVFHPGTQQETEQEITDLEDAQVHGHLCHVDLFRAPPPEEPEDPAPKRRRNKRLPPAPANDQVVHRLMDGKEVMASGKCTEHLVGTTVTQAVNIGWQGHRALMFVFADLSVKLDGYFVLRYRFFDLFSRMQVNDDPPIVTEAYGQRFRIYSTKKFPGLDASTALTKHVAMWGVRVAVRETTRRRNRDEYEGSGEEDENSSFSEE